MPKRIAEAPLQIDLAKRRCISSYTNLPQARNNPTPSVTSTWTRGDIVMLRAVGTGATPSVAPVYFEASRSLLSRESTVFASMVDPLYSLSESLAEPPCVECDDDPKELSKLLEVIHDHRVYFQRASWKKLESVSALLRLSTKYRIDLRNRMIKHLEATRFPTTPEAYLTLQKNPPVNVSSSQHLVALALLVDTGVPKLLPAAYYRCVTSLSHQRLIDLPVSSSPLPDDAPRFQDDLTKRVCIQLSRVLSDASTNFLGLVGKILLNEKHRGEAFGGATRCTEGFYRWIVNNSCLRGSQNGPVDVLLHLRASVEPLKDKVCPSCWRDVLEEVEITQCDIWDDLPAV